MFIRLGAGTIAILLAASAGAAPQPRGSDCLASLELPQKSFRRLDGLGLKFAFAWVDDIESKVLGGYSPFDLFIVTGRIFSPFELPRGTLERAAFERLSAPNQNIERTGPLRVPNSFSPAQPPALRFNNAGATYQLRVLAVKASRMGDDAVTIQVCRS
jgi:hypothetical protein